MTLLGYIGALSAIDSMAHGWYYRLTDTRTSAQKLLIVGAGPRTALQWRERQPDLVVLESVLAPIAAGRPNLMVLVDAEQIFGLRSDAVQALVDDPRWQGKLVRARATLPAQQDGVGIESLTQLDDRHLGWTSPTVYTAIEQLTAVGQLPGDHLPIHYLHPKDALPSLPMQVVAQGKVDPRAFEGKIVLIGATGAPWSEDVATPVGPMSPLEVHGHALAGVIDGVVWREVSTSTKAIILALGLLVYSWWLRGRSRPSSLGSTALTSVLIVLGDYVLYTRGLFLWGAAGPVIGVWCCQLLHLRDSFNDLTSRLGAMQTRLNEILPLAVAQRDANQNLADAAFWQDLVDLARAYVRSDVVTMIAELPANSWHLQLRASSGIALQDVEEKRRDIRRAPFRGPYLTHRAGWTEGFLRDAPADKTLLVPIQHEARLFGFWLVHVTPMTKLDDNFVATCEALGRQMAALIFARRYGPGKTSAGTPATNVAQEALADMDRAVSQVEAQRRWAVEVIEQDINGVLMASLWGPIEMINRPMREHLRAHFPAGIPGDDIRAVLAKITGGTMDQVQTLMRSAIVDHENVALPRPDRATLDFHADLHYSLRRIDLDPSQANPAGDAANDEPFPDMERARLMLVARREAQSASPPPLAQPRRA